MVVKFGILGVGMISLGCPSLAYAYIDPSAGQSLLQILIAAAVAGGIFFRFWFKRIVRFFSREASDAKDSPYDR